MEKSLSIVFPTNKQNKVALLAKVKIPNYNEARRYHKPIYAVLVAELYEAGCHFSAQQFIRLIQKEICLKSMLVIKTQVKDVPDLLYSLFDSCKAAETVINIRRREGLLAAFNQMHQCIFLLEQYGSDFLWLRNEAFQIVIELIEKLTAVKNTNLYEEKCRLYFSYAKHIMDENFYSSIHYLDQALMLSSGHIWRAKDEDNEYVLLRKQISEHMLKGLLKHGQKIMKNSPGNVTQLANKVISSIARTGIKGNEILLSKSYILLIESLLEGNQYSEAKKQLHFIVKYIMERKDNDCLEIKSQYNRLKGLVEFNLGNIDEAYKSYYVAGDMARRLGNRSIHANVLMNLGNLQGQTSHLYYKALTTLKEAYTTFNDLKDREQMILTRYRSTAIKANIIYPLIVDCIKQFDQSKLHWYNFLNWKNCCRPFWLDLTQQMMRNESCNYAFFLLNEYQSKG